jgi:hypothetical protein
LINLIESEIVKANQKKSVFELVWLIFFPRYLKLGITKFSTYIDEDNLKNLFLKSIITSTQKFFVDSKINMFNKPKNCWGTPLAKHLAVFDRAKE